MHGYIICFLVLLICTSISAWQCPVVKDNVDADTQSKLFQGQRNFAINFIQEAIKQNPKKNLVYSPYTIYQSLLLAYFGSHGTTETAFTNGLHLNWTHDKDSILTEYKNEKIQRFDNVKDEPGLNVDFINKYFFDEQVEVRDCMKTLFTDEIEVIEIYNKPDDARDHINTWVTSNTHEHIKQFLSTVDASAKSIIANAAYFNGLWLQKFDDTRTDEQLFHKTPTEDALVVMMKQGRVFNLARDKQLNCDILNLPYDMTNSDKNEVSFIAVIPKEKDENALEKLINEITLETMPNILAKGKLTKINLWLPKLNLEQTSDLTPVLNAMGLSNIFSNDADFSGFSDKSNNLFDNIHHAAKIELDENGSMVETPEVKILLIKKMAFIPFHVNRPFFYMVYDYKTEAVLFTGVYRGPE